MVTTTTIVILRTLTVVDLAVAGFGMLHGLYFEAIFCLFAASICLLIGIYGDTGDTP